VRARIGDSAFACKAEIGSAVMLACEMDAPLRSVTRPDSVAVDCA